MNTLGPYHKRIRFITYLFVASGIIVSWNLPRSVYESLQDKFVSVCSKFLPFQQRANSKALIEESQSFLLQEKIRLLEERILSMEETSKSPPLFPEILSSYFQSPIMGRVIFRDPAHWGSSCWINIGKQHGVKKNSPVVCGKVVVGLVDFVGSAQSRVRLITDVGIKPSVMAVRGELQTWVVKDQLRTLARNVTNLPTSAFADSDKQQALQCLKALESCLSSSEHNDFALRGIVCGRGDPIWKPEASVLTGSDFGFVDGKTIEVGDVLVTTGLDGVFPPGLLVATVSEILPKSEGACSLKIKAQSLAPDCSVVDFLVLPPMDFNPNDRPDIFGLIWE
ncbi:rod shape-determining protein MreC [Chlamydia muridarum str. Nigg]|jgi:Cell shape-determining protein|nr:rod shape-determining protein MreC [Chlamydia muridarum]UFU86861.1 PRK14872 family protein [Chlamydia trachomatis]AHH22407.1 rod shape-determining protein MreC [Chlamydia muridarum str. Nigg3 CMUT3-5]AHH23331.1 rod shape-determining protein MreC [Chlamydia muridarum str. Nigg CM972]AID37559.1 rod shape-determining protein MreC [Chlamydia muridarum str. Nigg 2 MCR]AIT90253.1 rod shape-determining protein MreC [Chlamydia muridarum]